MRKILFGLLGLLWVLPVMAVDYRNCQNLFDGEYISVNNGGKAENANNIYVSPGERYVALWTTSLTSAVNLYGYNTQGNQVGSWTSGGYASNGVSTPFSDNYMAWQNGAVFTVPDGVAYLRFNTFGSLSASQQQAWAESLKIYNMDCVEKITIASTKYVETEFSALNTALANAVATVNTVVTQTIAQAASIATLQSGKQTRPDETCPAGKKCLLVTDENNIPHWYEICSSAHCLPEGYTELEYIQSDGASYLIVPYRVNNKTVFYCKYNEIQNGPQTANAVFGVTDTPDPSKANNGILRLTGEGYDRMGWGNSAEGSVRDVVAPGVFNTWYEVLYDQNKLYQNGILYATSATEPSTSWAAENDLGIFARNSTSVSMPAVAKISSVWAKENSEYKINLIPAKRNSDDAIGMYDTVSGQFFTNQGTGEFTAGPAAE